MLAPPHSGTPCTVAGPAPRPSPHLGEPARAIVPGELLVLTAPDWTPRHLAVTLRLDAHECGMLRVTVHAREGGEPFAILLGLLPGLAARLSLDLDIIDGQNVFLRRHPGLLKGVAFGRRMLRADIARIELSLDASGTRQCLELGQPCLVQADVPWVDEGEAVVDEIGQWRARDWPGKTRDAASLVAGLRSAAAAPPATWPAGWSSYGGERTRRFEASGFFRTHHDGRRWWLVDPEGCAFWSAGLDCVRPSIDCCVVPGTEPLFAWLPSQDPAFAAASRRTSAGVLHVDFGTANLVRAFADGWQDAWRRLTASRMRAWRFNTVGNWSDPAFGPSQRFPWVMPMPEYPCTEVTLFRDLPDVFAPEFEAAAARWAEALAPHRDDPWLIGYFMANEPLWGFGRFNLAAEMLEANPGTHSRRALADWLRGRYADPAALSAAWGVDIATFEDLVWRSYRRLDAASTRAGEDLWAFSAELVRRHARIPAEACRRVDPHHLNLGLRWAWIASDLFYESAAFSDVFSINCYQMLPDAGEFATYARRSGRPVMIGEWHMGAVDRGLPSTGLRAVAGQHDRGLAYAAYVEAAAAHPDIVGAHWFTLCDQSVLGRFDGENYQIGFVDGCHQPYPEICAAATASHERIYALAAGDLTPTAARASEVPKIAF